MKHIFSLAAASALSMSVGIELQERFDRGYKSYTSGDRAKVRAKGSIAKRNRWTGKPHEDKRAMSRLERQEARRNV